MKAKLNFDKLMWQGGMQGRKVISVNEIKHIIAMPLPIIDPDGYFIIHNVITSRWF